MAATNSKIADFTFPRCDSDMLCDSIHFIFCTVTLATKLFLITKLNGK